MGVKAGVVFEGDGRDIPLTRMNCSESGKSMNMGNGVQSCIQACTLNRIVLRDGFIIE